MSLTIRDLNVDNIVKDASFTVPDSHVVAIVGPSGSGKTTLLHAIAGFIATTSGNIFVDDEDITMQPVPHRPTAIMVERPTLFDMSVRDNIEFGLDDSRQSSKQRHDLANIVMTSLNISGLADRHPTTLSGGQAQRVALARTLVRRPRVLLLDEPLAHIESAIRNDIHHELLSQVHRLDLSVLYVTHDINDACLVADRIIVLADGRIIQDDTPEHLFLRPANSTVARLMGVPNVISPAQARIIAPHLSIASSPEIKVAIPPSKITLLPNPDQTILGNVGQVIDCVFSRSHYTVHVETEIGTLVVWSSRSFSIGEHCIVTIEYLWTFADTERITQDDLNMTQ
ncbi:ABC transporter ATP-binding protein [Arcanobacterium buesumense]|uniref:ABC transporter ATP-binding protein n=1 Tax=Arcanobacterium buesumense TaxID=2722751 RepID=A0A6H2ELW3_9ACTO|nr:ABC transporter ATP-binding protein [Arcanobacterium buesumense]QJC22065.1 ABC transporter ATP-binding protein [Arcanobacterium buesumense]